MICYADRITPSMDHMLKETERRRKIQLDYNQQHKITPQPIIKPILANPITKEAGQEETRLKMQSSKELEASIKPMRKPCIKQLRSSNSMKLQSTVI